MTYSVKKNKTSKELLPLPKRTKKKKTKKEKNELKGFLKRLHYLLKHHSDRIDFQKLRGGVYALYEPETEEIIIDYRKDIIASLIHESLHHFYQDWSETKVIRGESRIMNMLTIRQIKNIIRMLGENL